MRELLISEYLDGELADDALKRVEEHLVNCPDCRSLFERMKAHRDLLLEHLPHPAPPAHMKRRLFQRIEAEPESRRRTGIVSWDAIGKLFPSASGIWAFTCVSMVFLAVVISAFQFQRYREDARMLAEIDRSSAQWSALDISRNPFNSFIQGDPSQGTPENPFKAFLNER